MHPDLTRPTRRQVLRLAAGLGAASALPSLLSACSSPQPAPTAPPAAAKPTEAAAPAGKPAAPAPAAAPAAPAAPAPAAAPGAVSKPTQGERLVVAVTQWGIETPFAWRSAQLDKPLWDHMFDTLILRDTRNLAFKPGLATEWSNSADFKTWTFKLRQGVKFHGDYGELTAEDVKFTVEQNTKPDSQGGSAPFFKEQLDRVETPDAYTVVLHFKNPSWEVPSHFAANSHYQNIFSRKYFEQVGEQKASQEPIGSGPYRHVEAKQGEFHRFEAVPNHWRVPNPGFKEIVVRRMPDRAAQLAALRAGEVDIVQVSGDYVNQAKQAGFRIHEAKNAGWIWIVLPGQTTPERDDYSPKSPWVGEPDDAASQERARKVRLALNLAVNKQAIIDGIFQGYGSLTPYSYWYYPYQKGYRDTWKIPPYDPQQAKDLLKEAGYPNGFEIKMTITAQHLDGPDVTEAVALDWERVGIQVKRTTQDVGSWLPANRARKTGVAGFSYSPPSASDEPGLSWQRTIWSKGTFYLLSEGPYDDKLAAILRELDVEKRTRLTSELGQQLYDEYRGVQIGAKTSTWAVSKKVGAWDTAAYTPQDNNFEYIQPA